MRVAPAGIARVGVERDAPEIVARAARRLPIADRLVLDQVWGPERAALIVAATEEVNQALSVLDHHAGGDRLTGMLGEVNGGPHPAPTRTLPQRGREMHRRGGSEKRMED